MAATGGDGRERTLQHDTVPNRAKTIRAAREEIARALDDGATLDEVDERIIGRRRRMSADARDALWLYAWTEVDRRTAD